jgi:hypothetical protein
MHTTYKLTPADLNVADIFYECQSGFNIKCKALTRPEWLEEETLGKINRHWTWLAENVFSGEKISYGLTEGFEHYGPRLYWQPQYGRFTNGEYTFEYVGQKLTDNKTEET